MSKFAPELCALFQFSKAWQEIDGERRRDERKVNLRYFPDALPVTSSLPGELRRDMVSYKQDRGRPRYCCGERHDGVAGEQYEAAGIGFACRKERIVAAPDGEVDPQGYRRQSRRETGSDKRPGESLPDGEPCTHGE